MPEKRKMSVYFKMLNQAILNYEVGFQYDFHNTVHLFALLLLFMVCSPFEKL